MLIASYGKNHVAFRCDSVVTVSHQGVFCFHDLRGRCYVLELSGAHDPCAGNSVKLADCCLLETNQNDSRADTTAKCLFICANISSSTTSLLQGQSYNDCNSL